MGKDLETIRGGLERVWHTQGREFASFELIRGGRPDPDLWVQYLDGELNLRWPLMDEPGQALGARGVPPPVGAFLLSFQPGANAIFAVGALVLDDLALWIDGLVREVLAGGEAHGIECRVLPYG